MNRIKKRDMIGFFFFIVVGLSFALGSLQYGSIFSEIPNAAFFPFAGGVILVTLSLILLIPNIKQKEFRQKEDFFPQADSWKRLSKVVVILCFYGVVLEYLGFVIATFVFMILVLKFIERPSWKMTLITSFATTGFCYVIFKILLKVQLP